MIGLLPIWQTEAEAGCIQYRTIGGTSICTAWSTKGILAEIQFKQSCGVNGTGCQAYATATSDDNMIFCNDGSKKECTTDTIEFGGLSTGPTGNGCDPKHPQDGTFTDGVGHFHHGCTATFQLVPLNFPISPACQCTSGIADITPIEMDTKLVVTYTFPSEGDFVASSEEGGGSGGGQGCSSTSTSSQCSVEEHCSINPKKIVFIDPDEPNLSLSRSYQCNITSVTNGAIVPPPCVFCD
jgi:hypothetical protein